MTFFDLIDRHPWLTVFTVLMLVNVIALPVRGFFRHLNIRAKGWPPAHCDAGGNLKEGDK